MATRIGLISDVHSSPEALRQALNIFERDGDLTYDTSPVIGPDGNLLGRTRMVHIPDYACFHERHYYTPSNTGAPVYDIGPLKLGVAICYDRHYPEYMRALALAGASGSIQQRGTCQAHQRHHAHLRKAQPLTLAGRLGVLALVLFGVGQRHRRTVGQAYPSTAPKPPVGDSFGDDLCNAACQRRSHRQR